MVFLKKTGLFICCSIIAVTSVFSEKNKLIHPAEEFLKEIPKALHNKEICLITNNSSLGKYLYIEAIDKNHYNNWLEEWFSYTRTKIQTVFTAEHGLSAQEEETGNTHRIVVNPVSIHRKRAEQLAVLYKNCEVLVFDLPDAGVRPYTYRTNMVRSMHALNILKSQNKNILFYIIDHPNFSAHLGSIGPMVKPEYFSYVGEEEIPFIPGYTQAELAKYYHSKNKMNIQIEIFRLSDFDRNKTFYEMRYDFSPPSPALPHIRSLYCYQTAILYEGTFLEAGRNTRDPFCLLGHPAFKHDMDAPTAPGIRWVEQLFIPHSGRYKGKLLRGYRLVIEDLHQYNPVHTAYEMLRFIKNKYPHADIYKRWGGRQTHATDHLVGNENFRKGIEADIPFNLWYKKIEPSIKQFKKQMKAHEIY